jgi:hypothetical protein
MIGVNKMPEENNAIVYPGKRESEKFFVNLTPCSLLS